MWHVSSYSTLTIKILIGILKVIEDYLLIHSPSNCNIHEEFLYIELANEH